MLEARLNLRKTKEIPNPTYYVEAIQGEYSDFAFTEDRAQEFKGHWREKAFNADPNHPFDLEIGTGSGYFFAHRAKQAPDRLLLGLEIKFKPLIQSIRRALAGGSKNMRIARYHAALLDNLFENGELDHVFIHHPDPWTKQKKQKHRLMNRNFLAKLHAKQKSGSFLDFKTDSTEYFFWAVEEFKNSSYVIERYSEDLHKSEWQAENFVTQFERFFTDEGKLIRYIRAIRK